MTVRIIIGDAREKLCGLPDASAHCCVSSPPYFGLRDYGTGQWEGGDPNCDHRPLPGRGVGDHDKKNIGGSARAPSTTRGADPWTCACGARRVDSQIGLEKTPERYVAELVDVFREVKRILRDDGTLWLNLGDSYCSTDKWGGGGNVGKNTVADDGSVPSWQVRNKRPRIEGVKPKDLVGIPWMVAFALRADGWWLRSAIIWAKPNGMPGSQEDRCTSSYEMVFQLSKSPTYFCDFDAIKTPPRESTLVRTAQDVQAQAGSHRANGGAKTNGPMKAMGGVRRDKQRGHSRRHAGFNDRWDAMERSQQQAAPAMMRDVWFVPPASYSEAHFAVMPDEIARRCILAGSPQGGVVFDPFGGAGTTGLVAERLGRDAILIELNPEYAEMARARIANDAPMFADVSAA